jgi:hypothetical protein
MIDFPTLFPNLVKYIPNWMERFYPSLAQFARGEGYPCGNKGVFIPRRNKCWTHPKTGNKLKQPLTYQKYQEAKEKSQKSRTEKGRTALQDREQGFRDKAREKAKGWQNKTPDSAKQLVNLRKNTELASKKPNQTQKEYDRNQPDLNIDSGLGMTEGWRTADENGSVRGIPWTVKMENKETPSVLTGARLTNHPGSNRIRRLELHTSDNMVFPVEFKKGDRDASLRARRLVKEIAQGKSQEMDAGDIKALIEGGKDGLAKRKVENARLATEEKQFNVALDSYLKSKNLTRESFRGMSNEAMDDVIEKVENIAKQQKTQLDPKPSLNSTGVKGAGGKSVDQQYKDIIASSKDPKGTEEEVSIALMRGLPDFHRDNYNEYSTAIKNNTVPKGYESHYQSQVDRFKPVVDNEDFINERRKKAIKGDYETEGEARVYVLNKMKEKGYKEHEYYDSPDYEKDYDKLKGVMKTKDVPPPLSGSVPSKDLRKTLNPGDKLFVKSYVSERLSNPSDYKIADGGEVLKVNIKNAKVRNRGTSLNGKPYDVEGVATLDEISHVIRDGKRYKVDDSDSSPNDLGVQEKATTKRRTKKKDFNSNLKLAQFAKPGCCCDASKPLRRRKTKQTPRLKRRGTRYA